MKPIKYSAEDASYAEWISALREEIQHSLSADSTDWADDAASLTQLQRMAASEEYLELTALYRQLSAILPDGERCTLPADATMPLAVGGNPFIAEVLSGSIAVDILTAKGWKNLYMASPPVFCGINAINPWKGAGELRLRGFLGPSEINIYPPEVIEKNLTEHHKWEIMARLLSFSSSFHLYMHSILLPGNAYDIIRGLLIHISRGDFSPYSQTNGIHFICQRTGLARSSVARIISQLAEAGCIKLERGKLVAIGNLPEKLE